MKFASISTLEKLADSLYKNAALKTISSDGNSSFGDQALNNSVENLFGTKKQSKK